MCSGRWYLARKWEDRALNVPHELGCVGPQDFCSWHEPEVASGVALRLLSTAFQTGPHVARTAVYGPKQTSLGLRLLGE